MTARGTGGRERGTDDRLVHDARLSVLTTARRMLRDGLVVATSGNVSARAGDVIVVTPSGVPYEDLSPEDLPVLTPDGEQIDGRMSPTSETPLHLGLYADRQRDPVGAIVHTHGVYSTAVSTLVREVPAVHYVLAMCGGPVRVAEYATYGSPELAHSVRVAMAGRTAALMANHGSIAVGRDLAEAYEKATQLEWACRVYLVAAAAGTPTLLPGGELETVAEKLATYGQDTRGATGTSPQTPVQDFTNRRRHDDIDDTTSHQRQGEDNDDAV